MKNQKLFSILCLTLTASMVLYGCSGTSSSGSSTDHTSQEAEAQANTVTAQITSIDGSTVTATVGALTAAQAPGGDNGNAPSGEAPVKPDDENASGGAPDSSVPSLSGDLFYVTNTSCTISLKDTKLVTANDQLLTIAGNNSSRGWGTSGSNGGDVMLTTSSQTMDGNITVDNISTLDMTLSDGSAFTGTINSTGDAGEVNVTLDSSSTWTLTGDSYITSFDGDLSQINGNGYQLYVNGSAIL